MKYYSVQKGRIPGIYTTWENCKEQVNGFPGAVYKSFGDLQSAQLFLKSISELICNNINTNTNSHDIDIDNNINTNTNSNTNSNTTNNINANTNTNSNTNEKLEIYTDGSHIKSEKIENGHIGIGAFTIYNGKEYSYSQPVTLDILQYYNITEKISNCTAEFLAVTEVLKVLESLNMSTTVNTTRYFKEIIFYNDYIGVEKWINGEWKTKKSYISTIKKEYFKLKDSLKIQITFRHVPAHTGVYENEKADKLAKSGECVNEFKDLYSCNV